MPNSTSLPDVIEDKQRRRHRLTHEAGLALAQAVLLPRDAEIQRGNKLRRPPAMDEVLD